jgi:ribosomal protein S21|tara:strand:+ start:802 stop:1038 length:237 start_codon:yes stop_codon:yes gene_type:complete
MSKKAKPVNVEVTPKKNESTEGMIKRFTKKVKKEGIQDEWREKHMYFEKPTDKRRRKKKERNRVIKKLQRDYDAKYKD